jgi:hypothetical protein
MFRLFGDCPTIGLIPPNENKDEVAKMLADSIETIASL